MRRHFKPAKLRVERVEGLQQVLNLRPEARARALAQTSRRALGAPFQTAELGAL